MKQILILNNILARKCLDSGGKTVSTLFVETLPYDLSAMFRKYSRLQMYNMVKDLSRWFRGSMLGTTIVMNS
jgi:hypothetical protein